MSSNLCKLNEFSVIKLTGEDNHSFLQGQVTCDVNNLKQQLWIPGSHCNAKGKMWSTFLAFEQDQAIYLVLTNDSAAITLAELNKYGVFSKVDISNDSDNWFIYGSSQSQTDAISMELSEQHFLIVSETELNTTGSSDHWWQQEVVSGRAHLYTATSGEYVPQMLNLQALDYISFNKGCYMGQEMVARMRYLGKNKRALYIASIDTELNANVGDDVAIELNGNLKNIGKVLISAQHQGKTYFQLVLPKDTQLSDTLYINTEHSITLLKLPYEIEQ